ncbi:MAG: SPOR domain-containing protein [Actinobacteria bacterium]|nr:SPOR domain-containing protein [Actinomycetota bacterium]
MTEYYYNLETGRVEEGRISQGLNRMGPYATYEEALQALVRANARNLQWEEEDRKWDEDWDGEPQDS